MKITFDSNVWESIFAIEGELSVASIVLRAAMMDRRLEGFISEAAFRIEAVAKKARGEYFAEPRATTIGWSLPQPTDPNLVPLFSFGPDNSLHPGLPAQQIPKLKLAAEHGVFMLRSMNWMGLPVPEQLSKIIGYRLETIEARDIREQRQSIVFDAIQKRAVGKAVFDNVGGWTNPPAEIGKSAKFAAACAEWADGELVVGHIGYSSDVICTNDFGGAAGHSILNAENRKWLTDTYGVRFMTINELALEFQK